MHFGTKSYLKSTRNHTAKHALSFKGLDGEGKEIWMLENPSQDGVY